ncbi:nuclear transport factor 2 family protein [Mycobacterium sp. NPDC006124]|uniref:nuclear transport factor 2 family protein n=1 Tax=Mycobacterium sp. NPDC006124 TaxID=3156729 RepID=UPI0033A95648
MVCSIADVLAAVERSPEAAGAHDRDGWIGLFAPDGRVEDPVGSRPHVGRAKIARFYDTFIGPRDITFHRGVDVVVGHTVVRDLTLEVRMGPSVTMRIPAYLRYDLDDSLKIVRLQAFWELPAMMWQFVRTGAGAVPAAFRLSRALLRNQRLAGTAGFLAGLRGVTSRAKRHVARLLDDACAGDQVAVKRRLADAATLSRGDDERIGTSELVGLLHGARWDGMIRAGTAVAVRVCRDGRQLVLIADLETRPTRIRAVRVFTDDQWT